MNDEEYLADVLVKFVTGKLQLSISEAMKFKAAYERVSHKAPVLRNAVRILIQTDPKIREFFDLACSLKPELLQKAKDLGIAP